MNAAAKQNIECPKCNGKGRINGFSHYANGVCFMCSGSGQVEIDAIADSDVREFVRNRAEHAYKMANCRYLVSAEHLDHPCDDLAEAVKVLLQHRAGLADWCRNNPDFRGCIWDRKLDREVTKGDVRAAGIKC